MLDDTAALGSFAPGDAGLIECRLRGLPHPDVAPWVLDFIEEVVNFPNAAHDDMVDAMSQALTHFDSGASTAFMNLVRW